MNPVLEAIGRADFRCGFAPHEDDLTVEQKWTEWPEERERSIRRARAQVKALRDHGPTEAMLDAVVVDSPEIFLDEERATALFHAMLTALIEEMEGG